MPPASDEVVMAKGGAFTINVSAFVADADAPSVTFTVKLNVPAAPGVPDIVPPAFRLKPAGSVPAMIDHAYGGLPPLAPRLCE